MYTCMHTHNYTSRVHMSHLHREVGVPDDGAVGHNDAATVGVSVVRVEHRGQPGRCEPARENEMLIEHVAVGAWLASVWPSLDIARVSALGALQDWLASRSSRHVDLPILRAQVAFHEISSLRIQVCPRWHAVAFFEHDMSEQGMMRPLVFLRGCSVPRCSTLILARQRSGTVRKRTKSCEIVRNRTKSCEIVRNRAKSYEFVRNRANSHEFVRFRTISYEFVRNRPNSHDFVRFRMGNRAPCSRESALRVLG